MEAQFIRNKKAFYKRGWFIALSIIFILLAPVVIYLGYNFFKIYGQLKSGELVMQDPRQIVAEKAEFDMVKLIDESGPRLGPKDAPITIIEFGDFNCPRSLESFPIMKEVMAKYPDQVRFFWRNFPVVKESSVDFARGGVCAHRQNKFWELHDVFFQTQGIGLGRNLDNLVKQAGLDYEKYKKCSSNSLIDAEIRKDVYAGDEGDVAGTPTFFINGYKIEGPITFDYWQQIIDMFVKIYETK